MVRYGSWSGGTETRPRRETIRTVSENERAPNGLYKSFLSLFRHSIRTRSGSRFLNSTVLKPKTTILPSKMPSELFWQKSIYRDFFFFLMYGTSIFKKILVNRRRGFSFETIQTQIENIIFYVILGYLKWYFKWNGVAYPRNVIIVPYTVIF